MREVVLVSSVRTPVGRAYKGTLRATRPDELAAVAIKGALDRVPQLDPKEIEDVILGCAMPEAEQGMNVARIASLRAAYRSADGRNQDDFTHGPILLRGGLVWGRAPRPSKPSAARQRLHRPRKKSVLHLILGGAAVHRCDKQILYLRLVPTLNSPKLWSERAHPNDGTQHDKF